MYKRIIIFLTCILLCGCSRDVVSDPSKVVIENHNEVTNQEEYIEEDHTITLEDIGEFDGVHYSIVINNNHPFFTKEDLEVDYDLFTLSELDDLGRAGVAECVCSKGTISEQARESLDFITPSGYQNTYYDSLESTIYNRCHLLMFKACGGLRTDVVENIITGTVFFNTDKENGMLNYETQLLSFITNTDYHVLYRVTPFYNDNDLVAKGVLLEAASIEDEGNSFSICAFVYNEQPGITIEHNTGYSYRVISMDDFAIEEENTTNTDKKGITIDTTEDYITSNEEEFTTYVLNTNTHKFHYEWCNSVSEMKDKNKEYVYDKTREKLIDSGYSPCHNCEPRY